MLLLVTFAATGWAQDKSNIKSQKIAFITNKLDLSPEEAQQFWPVYNKADKEMSALKKEHRQKQRAAGKMNELSDKEVEQMIDAEIAYKQSELDLMKKYHAEYKKVLPVKKVARLYKAEEQFKRELIRRVKGQSKQTARPGGRPGGRPNN